MASAPLVPPELPEEGQELTDEQWWALFDYLRLTQGPLTEKYGGPVEFVRRLREDEDPFREDHELPSAENDADLP